MNNLLDLDFNSDDFNDMSDDELAVAAKNSKTAANALAARYLRLVFTKSGIYANSNTDSDDLCQEGLLGLLSAVAAFSPERNVKFSTFAEVCIENRMKSLLAKGSKSAAPVADIDELAELQGENDYETPESIYLCKAYVSELLDSINKVLSPAERRVFELCVSGHSYRSAAGKLGITEKSVDNAMQRARRKIRALVR